LKIFSELFPRKSIAIEKIRELFAFPVDKYDKIISVCMVLAVAAVFNPIMVAGITIARNSAVGLVFVLALIAMFIFSLIIKRFSFIGMGIIAVLKLYPFSEAMSDVLFAAAMLMFVYFLVRKRND